jgi:endonuclease YncB( thermonuclease family)
MRRVVRYRRKRVTDQGWAWVIVLLLAAGVWIDGYGLSIPSSDRIVSVVPHEPVFQGPGFTVSPSHVIDGDTVRVGGETFRLVGFNTPETGRQAQCAYERDLGHRATDRLRSLVGTAASVELTPVQCKCRPGTHGTSQCNYGRSCGSLHADGRDVGSILISEGLARSYACGPTGCPRRHRWC